MKKIALISIIILLISQTINAQLSIGFEGGVNLTTVHFKNYPWPLDEKENSLNYFFGLVSNYQFNSKIGLLAELQYSTKGYQFDFLAGTGKSRWMFTYIDISPEVVYSFHENIDLEAGPYVGIWLNEKFKTGEGNWEDLNEFATAKTTDFGIVGSVRIRVNNFHLKIAYRHGLNNLSSFNHTDENGNPLDLKMFNRQFQIGFGYTISLKKDE